MNKFKKFMSGKGYYIALILCAVAIGISGYLYYRNADTKTPAQQYVPAANVSPTEMEDLPAAATQPMQTPGKTDEVTPSVPVTTKPMQTASPVEGETVMTYAVDHLDYNPTTRDWRTHSGVDIAAQEGTPVCAAADGTVYNVFEDETMGMTVILRHEGGYTTCYASLADEVAVKAGDTVTLGQKLGTVGNTALLENAIGEHVHFSVLCDGEPMDPAEFLALD